jgi:hypothetical protein
MLKAEAGRRMAEDGTRKRLALLLAVSLLGTASAASAQDANDAQDGRTVRFLAGAAAAFVLHEAAHVTADVLFGATPRIKGVDFHGIPFFAITPEGDLSRREIFVVSSAGFWVQHAGNEWILTRDPDVRKKRAPFRKGMLAFNVLTSVAYAGVAFARTGPDERDTLGMANGARLDERLVGALLLAPATLDAVRYFDPDARWAVWASRGAKVALVLLALR